MALLEILTVNLGASLVKVLAKLWFKDNVVAEGSADFFAETLKGLFPDFETRRATHRLFEDLQDEAAKWCIREVGWGFLSGGLPGGRDHPIGSPTMTLRARAVSDEEREELGRMARSRTLGAGLVRRARIIVHGLEGLKAPEICARMDLCGATVRHWLKRFDARGLRGLEEDVRTGRPPTCSAEEGSAVIDAALTRPADLGLPFASWTSPAR
jgi:hypothetical protein